MATLGALALGLLLVGCRTAPSAPEPGPGPLLLSSTGGSAMAPDDLLLLEELRGAWLDGDTLVARRLLDVLRSQTDDERVLALADDYRRRLDGRELGENLELGLICGPAEGDPGQTVVRLSAVNGNPRALALHLLTPTLERRMVSLGPMGLEARSRGDQVLGELERVELAAGERRELELARFRRPTAGAIAARESYTLDPAGSWLIVDGELLPLPAVEIAAAVRTGVAGFLPDAPLEPGVLIDYLNDPRTQDLPEEVLVPALLERAVRIPPGSRATAVVALAEAAPGWSDARLSAAAPAFRWLSGALEPGGDPRAWRRYFASVRAREESTAAAAAEPRSSLVVPGRR